MNVFGNGVISGWNVTAEAAFSLSINEGFGNINFIAARTEFPFTITNVPPNSINYVYAVVKQRTRFAEDVEFVLQPTADQNDPNFLLLAEVTTGANSIENIDNSVRQEIGFLELIKAAIRLHKHRGGSQHPSKIDLSSEVKGQLPSFRIADFDAEKITTGTFDLARLPLLNHQDLDNVGLLTHPQLDTFVKTLEASNKELFGEIATADLLQMILGLKFIYDDPQSPFYISDRTVDETMINEIALIPGITPDTFIDFDHSTAQINTDQHFIEGQSPSVGTSFYVTYDSDLAWNSARTLENVIVAGNTVTLAFNDEDESSILTLENFEAATAPGQNLSGSNGQNLFRKETVVVADNASILSDASATNVIEGFYSGRFTHRQTIRSQFVKEFNQNQDWSTYDSFVLNVKCLDSIHGAVKIFFFDTAGNTSPEFTILDQDEVTTNSDPNSNAFELRVIDIAQIEFRQSVKGFIIFSDDTDNPFSFFIDFINLQRAILLPESGRMVLRYSASNTVTFAAIEWNSSEPSDSQISVRSRAANGTAFLTRSEYTSPLRSGDIINLQGSDIEIEVTFLPDSDRLQAPVLRSLRILIITDAEIAGFQLNSLDEFSRGRAENVTIDSTGVIQLDTPVYVDSYYFCLGQSVNQIHENIDVDGNRFTAGELAIFARNTPIAPNQIFAAIEKGENRVTLPALQEPRCVRRKAGRSFVVADTFNDRILEFSENGELLRGVGSINYEHSTKTFPIGTAVDVRTGILYVVWSRKISFKTVNVSKITIQSTTQKVRLVRDFDKIMGLSSTELEAVNAEGQIMPIHLADQNFAVIEDMPSNETYLFIDSDIVSTGINADSVYYKSIATGLGIPIFIGNFAYISGISVPTFADRTEANSFVVANATVAVHNFETPEGLEDESISLTGNITPIIEIDENNAIVFGSDKMEFSPFVPGRVEKIDNRTYLIGGIRPGGNLGASSDELDFRSITGDAQEKQRRRKVLESLFFGDASNPKVGAVIVFDRPSSSTTFEYISPEGIVVSDVDVDSLGQFVVAESSFTRSGRVIKLDATGSIVFSFGEGLYSIINSARVQLDGSIVIST